VMFLLLLKYYAVFQVYQEQVWKNFLINKRNSKFISSGRTRISTKNSSSNRYYWIIL
jgi:hypothetical protein